MATGQPTVGLRNPGPRTLRAVVREAGSFMGRAHDASVILREVADALPSEVVTIRVILPDAMSRLRQAAVNGEATNIGRKRAQRRREVFQSRDPVLLPLRTRPGEALAILPVATGTDTIGLVEAQAPLSVLKERWKALQAAASSAAQEIRRAHDMAELKAYVDASTAAYLASELMRAGNPPTAVRAVLDFYFDWFNVPTGAWLSEQPGSDATLIGLRGLGGRRSARVRKQLSEIPRWESLTSEERGAVIANFENLAGLSQVAVLHVGVALFLIGGSSDSLRQSLDIVATLLEDVFDHLATVSWAERRIRSLDLGIALTAHEIRGPLVGAKAAIERSMTLTGEPAKELLRRSSQELDHVSDLAEGLLRWAVGMPSFRRRKTDVMALVEEVVQSCQMEMEPDHPIRMEGSKAVVMADPRQLRSAISNLVRNAIAYSGSSCAHVVVGETVNVVRVSVRDHGPGIAATERDAIFDPFVRGEAGRDRNGSGLGLYIARRIVEAHGGRVWVDSNGEGATFQIELPAAGPK